MFGAFQKPLNPFRKRGTLLRRKHKDLRFAFNRVFDRSSTQQEVFEESTKDIVEGVLNGLNCSVFAYGATGAGEGGRVGERGGEGRREGERGEGRRDRERGGREGGREGGKEGGRGKVRGRMEGRVGGWVDGTREGGGRERQRNHGFNSS